MINWEERRRLVKIANLYYNENWTQDKIAKKFDVSRPIISKALQRGKDLGIIKVFINDQTYHTVALEEKLEERYQLKDVVIVPNIKNSSDLTMKSVAKAGADYVSKNLKDVTNLGISWGETLSLLISEYPFEMRNDINVIPLEGGMGSKRIDIHANHLAYELSNKIGANCSYLYAPAIVSSPDLYERLIETEDVNKVLQDGKNVDMALVGIGNPYSDSTLETLGYIDEDDKLQLKNKNVIGDVGFRFFNKDGIPVDDVLERKMIGISLEKLKEIPKVVAVASGEDKAESILAALKGQIFDVLIIDYNTASLLI